MKNTITSTLLVAAVATVANLAAPQITRAHCEVPCGIYADQLRFQSMLEDQTTIAKAVSEMAKHLASMEDAPSVLAVNQLSRWVSTKEDHATRIQHTIAQYFMTQRIKADADGYAKKLAAAHAVMVAAMKTKQDPSAEVAGALREAIYDFYRAYEGKEPVFE